MTSTRYLLGGVAGAIAGLGISTAANALLFDQNVTPDVIFGSGNANGAFTVDRSNGVELGLRAKLRFNESNNPENTFNSKGNGTYVFNSGTPPTGFGFQPNSPTTPIWNFEWSINSDFDDSTGVNLDDLTYLLQIDFDSGPGTNFLEFDPINLAFADHAVGDNSTGNGDGTVASDDTEYASLIGSNNVAQNSWNMEFFNDPPFDIFDPNDIGTYEFVLTAFDSLGTQIAQTNITVQTVPEPGALAVFGLGLAGLGVLRRRR